jgi:hypothetical protein
MMSDKQIANLLIRDAPELAHADPLKRTSSGKCNGYD